MTGGAPLATDPEDLLRTPFPSDGLRPQVPTKGEGEGAPLRRALPPPPSEGAAEGLLCGALLPTTLGPGPLPGTTLPCKCSGRGGPSLCTTTRLEAAGPTLHHPAASSALLAWAVQDKHIACVAMVFVMTLMSLHLPTGVSGQLQKRPWHFSRRCGRSRLCGGKRGWSRGRFRLSVCTFWWFLSVSWYRWTSDGGGLIRWLPGRNWTRTGRLVVRDGLLGYDLESYKPVSGSFYLVAEADIVLSMNAMLIVMIGW